MEKKCEDINHRKENNDTMLYIRGDGIIRLCTDCVNPRRDEPLNKSPRFDRRRLLPDHNKSRG